MPKYAWKPKVPAYFPQRYSPPKQPPFPPGLRFGKMDVVFEKEIDWWASDAPYPYVDPRDLTRNALQKAMESRSISNADAVEEPLEEQVADLSVGTDSVVAEESKSPDSEVSKPEKRSLEQKRRRNTESGRFTQHQRRNFQRYKRKNSKKCHKNQA
ncbi:unnamed protein product [Allacma fusca]|uniref:Uncharacterized protein n=1 Tax=Allacma fusca TaxID=39272 RepID=A0A8J2K723_9HEXA|nr:unnamed protein product [Allacma fusca]